MNQQPSVFGALLAAWLSAYRRRSVAGGLSLIYA